MLLFHLFFQYDKFPHSHGFMALRRHTHAWGGCPSQKAACTPTIFKCRQQPSAGNRKPTPSPCGRGQNPPPFRTDSHGRGDGFAAHLKKAACTLAEISNPKMQAAFSRRRSRIVPNLSAHPFRQIRLDMRLQRQHIHRIRYIGSIQLHRVFFSNEHIIGGG